ncbi:MAG: hypothetical protein IEMM0006_0497 [bacterium]|nr:MAG: hypothetical protein IEMM0006_0497 [bacterium]
MHDALRVCTAIFCVLILLFASGFGNRLQAQQNPDKKTMKIFRQAVAASNANDFIQAESFLKKVLKRDAGFVKAYLLQGDIYASQHSLEKAIGIYRRALSLDSVSYPAAFFVLAGWEYKTGNYTASLRDVQHFLQFENKNMPQHGKAEKLLKNAAFAANAVAHPEKTTLKKLNNGINSPADEYINFVDVEGKQLFFTRKFLEQEQGKSVYKEHFYLSVQNKGVWQPPEKMQFSWDSALNMGGMSLSTDEQAMYFTGCYWPGGFGSCDIYASKKRDHSWLFPKHLDSNVNTSRWDSQAVISSDKKQLFFASKRPGGKGGSDIWMSTRQADGRWGNAINLGDSINTAGNEMAPFLHADNRTLYFSSNGRTGMGGYDLYVSREDSSGHWSKAMNLGYPVNTKANEISLFISPDGSRAWLSSDRDTTRSGFDIFSFPVYAKIRPGKVQFVKGVVQNARSGKKLSAGIVLTDLTTGQVVDSAVSDTVSGRFLMVLHGGTDYAFNIQKKGYLIYSQSFNLKEFPGLTSVNKTFKLTPIAKGAVMRLQNIRFGFDHSTLKSSAFPELNKLVIFLRKNSMLRILIAGYTDNIGSVDYNLKLSQERAKAVFDYLVSKGIDAGRMQYRGFGNTHPISNNQTPGGRAANRRTEIIIR